MIPFSARHPKRAIGGRKLFLGTRFRYIFWLSWSREGTTAQRTKGTQAVKPNLHPVYQTITAHCQCGNTFETRSTAKGISVEVCAQCHPYFTGKQRLVDTAGRIDRFRRKYASDAPAAS